MSWPLLSISAFALHLEITRIAGLFVCVCFLFAGSIICTANGLVSCCLSLQNIDKYSWKGAGGKKTKRTLVWIRQEKHDPGCSLHDPYEVSSVVRQKALLEWKRVVQNTLKALKDLLGYFMRIIITDKRQISGNTLGDLVQKL
ncbi:hypothetical protein PROFUN_12524 [Planoprotostelium fungivorum]|uniref:Uncharacterized protein n=1 Tax=Planoprotostelium fungivorum TaxID=1890364 RepID=A0A2P6MS35_9EUKA|nr:hypothetical protein PROFUN_12524 [Planoprotostelium fungivorum]